MEIFLDRGLNKEKGFTLHFHGSEGRESMAGWRQKVWYPLSQASHTNILESSPGCLRKSNNKWKREI